MFILSKISELVRVPPDDFARDTSLALQHQLNKQYAGKVIPHVGLCVAVYDLLDAADGQLMPGDGAAYVAVTFRALVLRPAVGEVLTGWITHCDAQGIRVALLGLFDDVFIPARMLFEGCRFSPDDGAWVWPMDEDTLLYFDVNETVRFRVEQELFVEVKPRSPAEREEDERRQQERQQKLLEGGSEVEKDAQPEKETPPAYAILGSCQTDGMGLVSWWE